MAFGAVCALGVWPVLQHIAAVTSTLRSDVTVKDIMP